MSQDGNASQPDSSQPTEDQQQQQASKVQFFMGSCQSEYLIVATSGANNIINVIWSLHHNTMNFSWWLLLSLFFLELSGLRHQNAVCTVTSGPAGSGGGWCFYQYPPSSLDSKNFIRKVSTTEKAVQLPREIRFTSN